MSDPRPTSAPAVLVIGAGLAGMAAAVALESAGLRVTLLEARHALGGRATSFTDPDTGEELDNCQHVLLACCTNLLDFYRRIGAADKIRWERTVHFLDERGHRYDLWGGRGVPAPLHMAASMATFGLLTLSERLKIASAMMAMLRAGKRGRDRLDAISFGEWLAVHGQTDALVRKFYDPVLVSALNEACRRCSAKYAIQVFQDAMLANDRGYVVGVPACPLGELYRSLPLKDLRLNTRVDELVWEKPAGLRVVGVKLRDGSELRADAIVLATNHHAVQRWVPDSAKTIDARFAHLDKLESVPILGAHLWFDRPILAEPAAALTDGPLHWLFRKDAAGRAVHGVISAAREWVGVPKEDALTQFAAQVRRMFPRARAAKLQRGVIVIEKRATFAPLPGADAYRPQQGPPQEGGGGIANLYLAGDYTRTDWPATMEGAVRGGYRAAEAVLRDLGRPQPLLVPDLPVQWPARLLGL